MELFSAVKYTRTDRLEVKYTALFPKIQRKSKQQKSSGILTGLCREGLLDMMLEEYIFFCKNPMAEAPTDPTPKKSAAKGRFPNVAGFCRFMKTGIGELEALQAEFPEEYERILSVFEDEALNSDLSSALLSSYMKKRLFYERTGGESKGEGEIKVCFEHDIFGDGE